MAQKSHTPVCCPECFKNKNIRIVMQIQFDTLEFKCFSCGHTVRQEDLLGNSWFVMPDIPKQHYDRFIMDDLVSKENKITPTFEEAISKFVEGMKYFEDMDKYFPRLDGSDSFICPRCGKSLVSLYYSITGRQRFNLDDRYKCYNCAGSGCFKFIYTSQELSVKTIQMCKTYQDTIVEIKIIGIPRKGWWDENAKPLVEFLKSQIPATDREYNVAIHIWSFDIKYWNNIETLFKALGWTIQVVSSLSGKGNDIPNINVPKEYAENFHYKQEVVTTQESAESIAKQLSKFLGVEITTQAVQDLKKLYRAKALELHPDRGGDAAAMSELNRLWTLYTAGGVQ